MEKYEIPPSAILIGNGVMGKRHLARLQNHNLVFNAVLDSETELREFWKAEGHNISPGVAIIASPATTHFTYAHFFLDQGWSVFVEKPLATCSEEAKILVTKARTHDLPLFVGHSERYHPALAHFPSQFREVFVAGRVTHMETHRENLFSERAHDVNVTFDILVHDLDLIFYTLGSTIAPTVKVMNAHADFDSVSAELSFTNGVTASLYANRNATHTERTLAAIGPNTVLKVDLAQNNLFPNDALEREYEALFATLQNAKHNREALQSALLAVQTAEAINSLC